MENATKALIIAAAVLVAIIIISLTLAIVRQGTESINNADLSEAEIAQFNQRFTVYQGTHVSVAQVRALLNSVLTHNQQQNNEGKTNFVSVSDGEVVMGTDATSIPTVTGSAYYTVTCEFENGLVTNIIVDQN